MAARLDGSFADAAKPGSSEQFLQLEGGTYTGKYTVPDGSLPGTSGSALRLSSFTMTTKSPSGDVVFALSSDHDFGAIFFDFFGPGTGDGFVFNGKGVQFQLGFLTGFTGVGMSLGGAIFGATGGPVGDISTQTGIASVPVPVPVWLLLASLGLLPLLLARRLGRLRFTYSFSRSTQPARWSDPQVRLP